MTQLQSEVLINAPKEKVWEILADFGNIAKFNLNLRSSHSTSKANGGIGATRHCDLAPMGSIEERIVDWVEGVGYSVDIYDGKGTPPFKTAIAHIKMSEAGKQTRVTMEMDYSIKFGPVGAAMDRIMIRSQFAKALPRLLQGLKIYAETGKEPTRADLKQLAVSVA